MINNPTDDWLRIELLIEYSGEKSVSAFARRIGLKRAENLYRIKRHKNGISKKLADAIATHFPEISRAWIILGEGKMLCVGNKKAGASNLKRCSRLIPGAGGLQ